MASVEKRAKGSYRVHYRDPAGNLRNKTFRRKVDAERFKAQVEVDKMTGAWVDPRAGRVLFGEWAAQWMATRVGRRPSTRARDESYLRNQVLPTFAPKPLAAIRQVDVVAWVASLEEKGLAPATITKAFQLLSACLDAAVDAELLAKTPCRNVDLPKLEREEMRFLTPGEVGDLADAMDPRYRALVLVGAYGGLRIGELAGLKRDRVDLLRGTIDVALTAVEVHGALTYNPPKTKAGRRKVTLPRSVTDELATHLASHDSEWVFPSPEGGPLRVAGFRHRQWRPAIARAGLEGLRIHDLRHTAVALWIASGLDVKAVSVRAGHTSVAFTLDRYGHLYERHDAEALDRLNEMINGAERGAGKVIPLR